MSKAVRIVLYVLLVLVVAAAVGLVIKFTNGFTEDFTTFYITVEETDVMSVGNDFVFQFDEPLQVDVHYLFDSTEKAKGYSVKVVPNKVDGKDIDFTVDGELYSFQAESDLTAGFEIVKSEKSFTIKPNGDFKGILEAVYPNKTIEVDASKVYDNMFTLVVTSYNEKASVKLNFIFSEGVIEITLDKESIAF